LRIPQDVPAPPPAQGFKTIPDSELVFGPSAANFDVAAYVKGKNGFLYAYSQDLDGELWSGVELIDRIAHEFSVNPRLLLALLEYQSGWLSNPTPTEAEILYPYGIINTNVQGLYLQLRGTANLLNAGYYGWRYRGLTVTSLADGEPLVFAPELNAGTVAVQYFFAQINVAWQWNQNTSETGFFQTYLNMFGDPFIHAVDPLVPNNLEQPTMTLPFAKGETWYFTGGPHGGFNTGSAWAAIDFAPPAPPDELINAQGFCYVSPNWVTAVAPGVIARSGNGFVVLDLDGDGNEHTGWVVVYLHIASQDSLPAGVRVKTGDPLGHPSCEGGFSNATHLHFARKYNGEWIPITCHFCASDIQVPPMVLSGWTFIGYQDQEYQGYAVHVAGGGTKVAEQGRDSDINAFSY
jgi:murein DD-endopeptidase MepM/ murein hydrolase activator NlpD